MSSLSQYIEIGDIDFCHNGISYNISFNHSASVLAEAKAINFATMMELVMIVSFFDPHEIAPPPSVKFHPLVDV